MNVKSEREGLGFFATPTLLAGMMVEMTFSGMDREKAKRESVCDPCCGTGTLLLAASNYSLNPYGVDLSLSMVRMCKLNGGVGLACGGCQGSGQLPTQSRARKSCRICDCRGLSRPIVEKTRLHGIIEAGSLNALSTG
jgi:hypothetical protein